MNSLHADVIENGLARTEQYVLHSLKNAARKDRSDLKGIDRIMIIMYPSVDKACYTDPQYQPVVEIFAACLYYKSYGLDYICSLVNTVYIHKFDIARARYEILCLIYTAFFGISHYEIMLVVKAPGADDCVCRILLDLAVDGYKLYEIVRRTVAISEHAFTLEFENGELIAEDFEFAICKKFNPQQTIVMRTVKCKGDRVLLRKLKQKDYNNKTATVVKRVTDKHGNKMIWVRIDRTGKLLEVGETHGVEVPLHFGEIL